jgi:hypothetical protein
MPHHSQCPRQSRVACADATTASGFRQCIVTLIPSGTFVNGAAVDPSLAKFEALDWVLADDTLSFGGTKSVAADALLSNDELIQRFGVDLLLHSLGLESKISATSYECNWSSSPTLQVDCDGNQTVIGFETKCPGNEVEIPEEIALLRNLEAMIIDDACSNGLGLGGSIPSTIGKLTQLTYAWQLRIMGLPYTELLYPVNLAF